MTDTLAAEFAAHADEALAVANETFDAAAEAWLRECVWPDCLAAKRTPAERLIGTVGMATTGVQSGSEEWR